MERDFDERAKKRKIDKAASEALKIRGNECMKKGLYKTAEKFYKDALQQKKDHLCVYTNLALAKLKLEKWQDAIDNCTHILEYCDVFDDCYTKQRDLCYKAFMRRAQGNRGDKDF